MEAHPPQGIAQSQFLPCGGPGLQATPGAMKLDQFVTVSWQVLGRRNNEDVFADNYQHRVNSAYRAL
jgi:hypothetical protein